MLIDIPIQDVNVTQLSQGIYLSKGDGLFHFLDENEEWIYSSMDGIFLIEKLPSLSGECFGVCDTPQQFINSDIYKFIATHSREFIVELRKIEKAQEPSEGSWKWSGWGKYIGTQKPTTKYLVDEPYIDLIYTFHIYMKSK